MVTIIASNKQAMFDYTLLKRFEAGIVLHGHEVKSVKTGHAQLKGAYVTIMHGEVFLFNGHIPAYARSRVSATYDPYRSRKLLLNKKEVMELIGNKAMQGMSVVPLSIYLSHNKIKVEIALARGKKQFEKRDSIKKRETDREIRRALKTSF